MRTYILATVTVALTVAASAGHALAQDDSSRGWRPLVPPGMERSYQRSRYAPASRTGDLVFLSGIIGTLRDGPNDAASQIDRAFQRLGSVLDQLGLSLGDVLEMTTYHVDLGEHGDAFMEAKNRYIEEPYPAWTAIGVDRLWLDQALIEIRVTAVYPGEGT